MGVFYVQSWHKQQNKSSQEHSLKEWPGHQISSIPSHSHWKVPSFPSIIKRSCTRQTQFPSKEINYIIYQAFLTVNVNGQIGGIWGIVRKARRTLLQNRKETKHQEYLCGFSQPILWNIQLFPPEHSRISKRHLSPIILLLFWKPIRKGKSINNN